MPLTWIYLQKTHETPNLDYPNKDTSKIASKNAKTDQPILPFLQNKAMKEEQIKARYQQKAQRFGARKR